MLDSWRGVAALLVVIYHCRYQSHLYGVSLIRNGWLAVDFFFVLSGFVLSHAYGGRIASARDLGAFVIRRTGRLWPLHVFMLAAMVAPWARGQAARFLAGEPFVDTGENTVYSILTNVLMVHALGLHHNLTWNEASWSVSTEYYTCVLYGLVVLLCGRFMAGASLVLAVVGVAGVIAVTGGQLGSSIDHFIFRCMHGFFAGTLVYLIFQQVRLMKIPRYPGATVAELATLALAGVFIAHADESSPVALIAPQVFGVVVLVFAFERGMISRLLQRRAFVMAGALSYSVYLTHGLVYVFFHRVFQFFGRRWGVEALTPTADGSFQGNAWIADGMTMVVVVSVVAVSMVTYRFVEQPWRRRFNRAATAWEAPAPQPHPAHET